MWPFRRKKRTVEADIQAVKNDTFRKIDSATKNLKKVNKVLDRDDITLKIYYATRQKGERHG